MMRNKKAAFEMSMTTIVTIVLSITLLVLGVFFVQNIFRSAKGVVDLTDTQLRNEINKLFSEENQISIYPGTRLVEIKQTTTDGVGIGIKNLLEGTAGNTKFSYVISAEDTANCGITKEAAEAWISVGKSASDLSIASGDSISRKVLFNIPVGAPLCIVRFKVEVNKGDGTFYAGDSFDIKVKAK